MTSLREELTYLILVNDWMLEIKDKNSLDK